MDEGEFVLVGKMTIKEISKTEEIRFNYKDNVFEGRCVVYSNDYEIKKQKTREESKILVKLLSQYFNFHLLVDLRGHSPLFLTRVFYFDVLVNKFGFNSFSCYLSIS